MWVDVLHGYQSVVAKKLNFGKLLCSAYLAGVSGWSLPGPAAAQEPQVPPTREDVKAGFFDKARVNEDFFKNEPAPNFGPLPPPPVPAPPVVAEVPQNSGPPDPENNIPEQYKSPGEENEALALKRKLLEEAQRDSGMRDLFERSRLIKEELGVSQPGESGEGSLEQLQESLGTGTGPGKKKIESHRF